MADQIGIDFEKQDPFGFTKEELTIMQYLEHGRGNAKTMSYLADRAGVNTRTLQQIIHDLIVEHKKPIGSTSRKPAGYFLVSNEADLTEATTNLRNRAMSILHRMASLKRVSFDELLGQLRIEVDDEH